MANQVRAVPPLADRTNDPPTLFDPRCGQPPDMSVDMLHDPWPQSRLRRDMLARLNAVARELQDEGLITTRRGIVEVHDREGLERRSCECYDRVEKFFGAMVGPKGTGS